MNELRKFAQEFFIKMKNDKVNHFTSTNFYNWLKRKGITVTKEMKAQFRKILKEMGDKNVFHFTKTTYKSNKVLITFRNVTLQLRKYVKSTWKAISDKIRELYETKRSAAKPEMQKLYKRLESGKGVDFTGCNDKRMLLAAAKIRAF